jgi:hypothetical protein
MSQVETRECQADIDAVEVYARGALVRRTLVLPAEMPTGPVALVVKGATPWMEAGSLRADLDGDRVVVGVRSKLCYPESLENPGALRAELDALLQRRGEIKARVRHLEGERAKLLAAEMEPKWKARKVAGDPGAHFGDALAAIELVDALTAAHEQRLLAAITELAEIKRACQEMEVRWQQASHDQTRSAQTPSRDLIVSLAPGAGSVSAVSVTYAVMRAQWWPGYTLRLSAGGADGNISADAFVAQATGEEWAGVRLSVCSGDLVDELALPELQSWRLGRRQRRRATGFRALPSDLDALFEGYERVAREMRIDRLASAGVRPAAQPVASNAPKAPMPAAIAASEVETMTMFAAADAPARGEAVALDELSAQAYAGGPPQAKSLGPSFSRGGGPGAPMPAPARRPAPPPPPVAPADGWLNFDSLALLDPRRGGRGELERTPSAAGSQPFGELAAPPRVSDLLRTRGTFDHRWNGEALCDVASDGVARRAAITDRATPCKQRLRCVPVETTEVYREVEINNPFAAPLLAGPIDVFVDGALLRTSPLETVDRGGILRVGLGEEERVTVVRKVRARESSKGLLGGTTHVVHDVEIELASALGDAIDVDVVDRLPVSDDKEVTISKLGSDPVASSYDGTNRGQPVRGGLSWTVNLPPGGAAGLSFSYAVDLDAKLELVGGNRRD